MAKTNKVLLFLALLAAAAVWVLVVAFGDRLGVPVEAQNVVNGLVTAAAAFVGGIITRALSKDKNDNGVPDVIEGDE